MNTAYLSGQAVPLAQSVSWLVRYEGSWWVIYERGWLRVTDATWSRPTGLANPVRKG
jgi:hypothetical protein